jgi:hypothetical protein
MFDKQMKTRTGVYERRTFLIILQVIGDTMSHDKSTISRGIRQVADALMEMKDTFIKWPQTPEKLYDVPDV